VNRIRKRTCHITIQLAVAEPGEIKKPVRRRPAQLPKAQPAPEVDETTPETVAADEAPAEEPQAEEKPKRARKPRAKKTETPEATAEAAEEPAADDASEEEK
jgi:hypothetical protein